MMIVPLTALKELTDCGQRHTMIQWLTDRGWKFEVGTNGWPKVYIKELERHMFGGNKRQKQLNVSAIR